MSLFVDNIAIETESYICGQSIKSIPWCKCRHSTHTYACSTDQAASDLVRLVPLSRTYLSMWAGILPWIQGRKPYWCTSRLWHVPCGSQKVLWPALAVLGRGCGGSVAGKRGKHWRAASKVLQVHETTWLWENAPWQAIEEHHMLYPRSTNSYKKGWDT